MGKVSYLTDSEETDDTSSSVESIKKKKKLSIYSRILKYTSGNARKKKCKWHARSEPEDSEYRSGSGGRARYPLPGILKHQRDVESSEDEEDIEPEIPYPHDRCLVGRVPRPAGAKPGRGGGVAIIVRRNVSSRVPSIQQHSSTSSTKRRSLRRLMKKSSAILRSAPPRYSGY
ncbi:hypothetical protein O3G_MSEX008376 [Manduca sexta]|uniref:Uncharacterized protein n=1 Tax=Manduca sexta TaxID=7130 RepID=A0A921Z9U9_MANSE|nr:hypothetical protein O3G_MSEX008376 [Manduca sexta]